jgi:hypothetical protein
MLTGHRILVFDQPGWHGIYVCRLLTQHQAIPIFEDQPERAIYVIASGEITLGLVEPLTSNGQVALEVGQALSQNRIPFCVYTGLAEVPPALGSAPMLRKDQEEHAIVATLATLSAPPTAH